MLHSGEDLLHSVMVKDHTTWTYFKPAFFSKQLAFQSTISQIEMIESKKNDFTVHSRSPFLQEIVNTTSEKENLTDASKRNKITKNNDKLSDIKGLAVLYSVISLALISGFGAIFEVWRLKRPQKKLENNKRETDVWLRNFSSEKKSTISPSCSTLPQPTPEPVEEPVTDGRRYSI